MRRTSGGVKEEFHKSSRGVQEELQRSSKGVQEDFKLFKSRKCSERVAASATKDEQNLSYSCDVYGITNLNGANLMPNEWH